MAENHVDKVLALLQAESDTFWNTADPPTIKEYQEDTQQERGQGADQPPKVYVWSPTSSNIPPFSLDGDDLDRQSTVEILCYALDKGVVVQLQEDVITSLRAYINDNKQNTDFTTIDPDTSTDYREQTQARNTEQYVMGVTVEPRRLA